MNELHKKFEILKKYMFYTHFFQDLKFETFDFITVISVNCQKN